MQDFASASTPDALAKQVMPSRSLLPSTVDADGETASAMSRTEDDMFYLVDMAREGDAWVVTGFERCVTKGSL